MSKRKPVPAPAPVEHRSERLRRLVDEFEARLRAEGLSATDAIYVAEGAASRVRVESEAKKLAERKVRK